MGQRFYSRFSLPAGIFFLLLTGIVQGQSITVSNVNISPSAFQVNDLLNVDLNNPGSIIQCHFEISLLDENSNPAVWLKTDALDISNGSHSLNMMPVGINESQFGTNAAGNFILANGKIPYGSFTYAINAFDGANSNVLSYHTTIQSDVLVSPYLITPMDKEVIHELNPLLGYELNNLLSDGGGFVGDNGQNSKYFELLLTKLDSGQTAEQGINTNTPLWVYAPLSGNQIIYPMDAPALERGGRYGWQIFHYVAGVIIDKSEAWEFTISTDTIEFEDWEQYARLSPLESPEHPCINTLRFIYPEDYTQDSLQVIVFDEKERSITVGQELIKNMGDNMYQIDLVPLHLMPSKKYRLKVTGSIGTSYFLRFSVIRR